MPKNKNKFKINENKKPERVVNERSNPKKNGQDGIIIDFSCPLSFYSCNIGKEFTNYLKNPLDFLDFRRDLFGEALSYFQKHSFDELALNSKSTHTHIIADDKIELLRKILKKLVEIKWPKHNADLIVADYMSGEIWQLGYLQGLRLIGSRKDNILNLLFIDYHHLVEPSLKHNSLDYYKYKYCPMSSDYCFNCKKN